MTQILFPDCLDDPVVETCFRRHLAHIPGARIYQGRPRDDGELAARLAEADCALLHFEARRVGEAALAQASRLRVIAIAGAGTGCVDLAAARARGIRIATTLQAAVPAVAEMTVGMMLALARSLAPLDARTRLGEWPVMHGVDLDGKTLGLVGLGAIARRVAQIAAALGMRVIAWSPHLTEARATEAAVQRRDLAALM